MTFALSCGNCSAFAIFARISEIYGLSLGACAITVISALLTRSARIFSISATLSSSFIESAFLYCGSLSGKHCPISESPAAPSIASISACRATSASECPSSPVSCGISTPHSTNLRPFTRACTSKPLPMRILFSPLYVLTSPASAAPQYALYSRACSPSAPS